MASKPVHSANTPRRRLESAASSALGLQKISFDSIADGEQRQTCCACDAVCLGRRELITYFHGKRHAPAHSGQEENRRVAKDLRGVPLYGRNAPGRGPDFFPPFGRYFGDYEIGRASCRERV